jgi:hypothetical protein
VRSASGIIATSVPDFAPVSHPNRSQKPHCTHAPRPPYGREAIAIGVGTAWSPSFRAARSMSTPDDLRGRGGMG